MQPENAQENELSRQIAIGNREGAKALARSLPPASVGNVLRNMAGAEKASSRTLVLELASDHPSEGASRAILSRLQDPNLTVRSMAGNLIARIAQKNLVPEMFEIMDRDVAPAVKGGLARQIGMIGDSSALPRLRMQYRTVQDPGLQNDLALAMARLGDEHHRQELIHRLNAPDATARVAALRDIPYVGEPRLARYFRPVLEDRRDAVAISLPHEPVVAARVCDIAIQTLAALGLHLSFATSPMRRFADEEIQETLGIVTTLEKME